MTKRTNIYKTYKVSCGYHTIKQQRIFINCYYQKKIIRKGGVNK